MDQLQHVGVALGKDYGGYNTREGLAAKT